MAGQYIQEYISKWTLPTLALMLGVSTRTVYNYLNMDTLPRAVQFALAQIDLTNGKVRNVSVGSGLLKHKMKALNWTSKELASVVGKSRDSIDAYVRDVQATPLDIAISLDYFMFIKELLIKYKKDNQ